MSVVAQAVKVPESQSPEAQETSLTLKIRNTSDLKGVEKDSQIFTTGDSKMSENSKQQLQRQSKSQVAEKTSKTPENFKVCFTFDEPSLTKYDVFQAFKAHGPLIRCFIKNKDSKNPAKKGFVKFRKVADGMKVQNMDRVYAKGFLVKITPNPELCANLEQGSLNIKGGKGDNMSGPQAPPKDLPSSSTKELSTPSPCLTPKVEILSSSSRPESRGQVPQILLEWNLEMETQQNRVLKNERLFKVVEIRHKNINNLCLNVKRKKPVPTVRTTQQSEKELFSVFWG